MKNVLPTLAISILFFAIIGCEKKDANSKVDENGLTKEITDLVPQYILDEMQKLGMPINGGATPPVIESTYIATPFILVSSNRPGDTPGSPYSDYYVTFSGQDNNELTIMVDYISGTESGNGIGSYIVGEGCKFSVFVEVNSLIGASSAKFIHVISGKLKNNGIEDLYLANFMIDDNGDPAGIWIENGEGRVFFDKDGFSEKLGTAPVWYAQLPDCPCEYADNIDGRVEMCGTWIDCGTASQEYHYGATYEIRWVPDEANQPGQQCTYDVNRKLITSGIAAGSPDKDSPDICGWGDILTGQGFPDIDHYYEDVVTWKTLPCIEYLLGWPANNKNACSENAITDIQHILTMVNNMTCKEVTDLFIAIDKSNQISSETKKYFHGKLNYTPLNLKTQLENLYNSLDCNNNLEEPNCIALKKAIDNLN